MSVSSLNNGILIYFFIFVSDQLLKLVFVDKKTRGLYILVLTTMNKRKQESQLFNKIIINK